MYKRDKMLIGILLVFFAMAITFPEICSAQYDQRYREREVEGPELREKFPGWTELEGSFRDYHFSQFPVLEYEQPDVHAWIASLGPRAEEKQDDKFVRVWHENDDPRYIFISYIKGRGNFYAVTEKSIELVSVWDLRIDLEVTPNGLFRWQYIYGDGLLRTVKLFGSPEGEADVSWYDVIRIYRRIVYWENSKLLKHIYVYRGEFEAISPDDEWASREDFDEDGKWIKSTLPGDEKVD